MENDTKYPARLSIDVRKGRIKIYKETYMQLGNPMMIQILIDPLTRSIAFRCPEKDEKGGQELHVYVNKERNEITSLLLVRSIRRICEKMEYDGTYRIYGYIDTREKIAVFQMDTMEFVSGEGRMEEKCLQN